MNGAVITTYYPAGSSAPSAGAPYGGAQACEPFAFGASADVTLSYELRVPIGFQFVKGGKLPGIYGGIEPFTGGSHNPFGWSMRLMWRTGGVGEIYAYTANTIGYGDDYGRGNFRWLADGLWHPVALHVHLNTPGHSDGFATLTYNGVTVVNQTGIDITNTATPSGGLLFSTFYGGSDSTWSPNSLQHLDFANFSAK